MTDNTAIQEILFFGLIFSHILFTLIVGYYLILNLQWYNYKINRVLFKHHKQKWHIFLLAIPSIAYFFTSYFFWPFFYFTYLPLFYKWVKKLDKPLVYSPRVKRFFIYLTVSSVFVHIFASYQNIHNVQILSLFAIFISIASMNINEYLLFLKYKKNAIKKLSKMNNLQIIQITASYGKTSIKNFIYEFLTDNFNTYKTPKSINTINGIIKDINNDLPINTQIYIVESGARTKNDILEITNLLNPQRVVLGAIGAQHLEYFKNIENIISSKSKILTSNRLQKAYIHKDNILEEELTKDIKEIQTYPDNLKIINSNLNNTQFSLNIDKKTQILTTNILGNINPENISVAINIARDFNINIEQIKTITNNLSFIPHRLEKIESMGKIIIDDSYNSNLDGMMCAINLVKQHKGKKIIITCGLVESDDKSNITIAKEIDKVFDIAIITSKLNQEILNKYITKTQKFILEDKAKLQTLLLSTSKAGDIILFANDAPNYI